MKTKKKKEHMTQEKKMLIQEIHDLLDEKDPIVVGEKKGIWILPNYDAEELKKIKEQKIRELLDVDFLGKKSHIPGGGDLFDIYEYILDKL